MNSKELTLLNKTRKTTQIIIGLCFCIFFIKHDYILNWLANYANREHLAYGIPSVCLALYFGLHIGKNFEWKDYSILLMGLLLLFLNISSESITSYIFLTIIIICMLISFIRS